MSNITFKHEISKDFNKLSVGSHFIYLNEEYIGSFNVNQLGDIKLSKIKPIFKNSALFQGNFIIESKDNQLSIINSVIQKIFNTNPELENIFICSLKEQPSTNIWNKIGGKILMEGKEHDIIYTQINRNNLISEGLNLQKKSKRPNLNVGDKIKILATKPILAKVIEVRTSDDGSLLYYHIETEKTDHMGTHYYVKINPNTYHYDYIKIDNLDEGLNLRKQPKPPSWTDIKPDKDGVIRLKSTEMILQALKDGAEVMVKGYADDWDNYTGIYIDDYLEDDEKWSDQDIIDNIKDYEDFQIWTNNVLDEGLNIQKRSKETPWMGIDKSLEESLFEYRLLVCQPLKRNHYDDWLCVFPIIEDNYIYEWINEKSLNDMILDHYPSEENKIKEFLIYLGINKFEWSNIPFVHKLYDIISYFGIDEVVGSTNEDMYMSTEDVIDFINHQFPGTFNKEDVLLKEGLNLQKKQPVSDEEMWKLIDTIGWGTRTYDYNKVQHWLHDNYREEKIDEFHTWVNDKVEELKEDLEIYAEPNNVSDYYDIGGDDSFDDLASEIVGRGKEYYQKVQQNSDIAAELGKSGEYQENFQYCFQPL